ncbi:hypothetical protein [Lewinella sp. IMCC34191]|uniref:hypothetical protein n=1 Tax=Lewinella sp. IMCC34191 TaxID=2259172 RepID=UPI000E22A043|nr:hypothetical protein [Lewinella sp. IMCC34191]
MSRASLLPYALLSAAVIISVNLCVAWLIRGTTNWPYPLHRLNIFSVCYVLICCTAGFLVIAREF